jgi:penicillin-binding protein 1A
MSTFLCGALFFIIYNYTVDFSLLSQYAVIKPSLLLDDQGNEWGKFQLDRRDPLDNAVLPKHLTNAFIAAEDWDFFHHSGISYKGILRSIVVNIYYGRRAQGASTITQQLVKLLFFDSQKIFTRKIKEQLYAILVENQLTKEQILHTYLNNVCFGCGIYGVEAASQRFWGKSVQDIALNQAATLAGIIRSPARYCPLVYPLSAQKRRDIILGKMNYLGFITQEEYECALVTPVQIDDKHIDTFAPHVKEMLRVQLESMVGKKTLYSGELYIQTTINKKIQEMAQEVFTAELTKLRKEFGDELDGAMIVLDRKTGEVKALIGGFDFATSKFNRAKQAWRQIGSTFKPLIYAVALQKGMTFADTQIDERTEWLHNNAVWAPNNYNKKFNGQITLAYALSHSNNIVSIKTLLAVGASSVIELAKKCRIKASFHTYPSLALGCIDTTLWQVAGMFNVFANDGIYVEPHSMTCIKDKWGTRIHKSDIEVERVLKSVLCLAPQRLKKMYGAQKWLKSDVISKTGTTNDSRTCWYVAATSDYTTAICIGFDDNRSMGDNVYPIRTAFPIWLAFNRAIEEKEEQFLYDPALHKVIIDERTGLPSDGTKPGAIAIMM